MNIRILGYKSGIHFRRTSRYITQIQFPRQNTPAGWDGTPYGCLRFVCRSRERTTARDYHRIGALYRSQDNQDPANSTLSILLPEVTFHPVSVPRLSHESIVWKLEYLSCLLSAKNINILNNGSLEQWKVATNSSFNVIILSEDIGVIHVGNAWSLASWDKSNTDTTVVCMNVYPWCMTECRTPPALRPEMHLFISLVLRSYAVLRWQPFLSIAQKARIGMEIE